MTVDGAADAGVFRTDVRRGRGPTLPPGDIVVMEHVRARNASSVQQARARRGARLRYVPPSSPDLALIEPCRANAKAARRKAQARTRGALDTAMGAAMRTVSPADAYGQFKDGGYPSQEYANRSSCSP
jgi:hypothetical protein